MSIVLLSLVNRENKLEKIELLLTNTHYSCIISSRKLTPKGQKEATCISGSWLASLARICGRPFRCSLRIMVRSSWITSLRFVGWSTRPIIPLTPSISRFSASFRCSSFNRLARNSALVFPGVVFLYRTLVKKNVRRYNKGIYFIDHYYA